MGYFPQWRLRHGSDAAQGQVISTDERLPWPQTMAMGLQHVVAMFGATVLAPLLMGFDPNLAIFMSGIGTLLFFVFVGGRVPHTKRACDRRAAFAQFADHKKAFREEGT